MKRLLLALALVLGVSVPASATWALTQAAVHTQTSSSGATTVTATLGSTPVTGHLMIGLLLWFDGTNSTAGTPTVKDANNVSFTKTTNSPSNARPTTSGIIYIFYLQVPATANGAITTTFNSIGGGGAATLWVLEFTPTSGSNGSFDTDVAGTGTTGTTVNTPTVTQTQANDLMIFAALSDHQVSSVDSPWTQVAAGIANQFSEGIGYILAQSSSQAAAATQNTSSGWDSIGASFKFTPAGGGGCVPTGMLFGFERCH